MLFFLFLTLPNSTNLFGQIVIKERVKIEPRSKAKHLNTTTSLSENYSVSFDVFWDLPDIEVSSSLVYPSNYPNSGANGWETGGGPQIITLSGNETGLFFMFQFKANLEEFEECTVNYSISLDGDVVQYGSNKLVGSKYDIPYVNVVFSPPVANDFNFNINRNLSCNNYYASLSVTPIFNDLDQYWRTDKPITFSIISDAGLVSFANGETDEIIGSIIEVTAGDLINKYLHINNPSSPSDPISISIEANANGIIKEINTGIISIVQGEFLEDRYQIIKNESVKISAWLSNTYCDQIIDIPEGTTFTAEIMNGMNFGKLINLHTNEVGDILSNIASNNNLLELEFLADEDEPISESSIFIRISCSIPNIQPLELDLLIKPTELIVEVEPKTLAPGDTANVLLKYKKSDGTLLDFPTDQTFDIKFADGEEFGNFLLVDGEIVGKSFYDIESGFKLIAEDSITEDNAEMSLKVTTFFFPEDNAAQIEPTNSKKSKKSGNKDKINFIEPIYGVANVKIKNLTILLGEAKYYQAKQNTATNELKIEEIQPDANGVPQQNTGSDGDWTWLIENVWDTNPVEIVEGTDYGERKGVYWEREKQMFDGNNLPTSLIRLVGRYWHEDSTYVVKLHAQNNIGSVDIDIKVIAPNRLGNQDNVARNIDDIEYNLDSLVIYYGGLYGIPPQLLKAQIKHESNFYPAYRYEPILDMKLQDRLPTLSAMQANAYWVSETGRIGEPEPPTDAANLRDGALNLIQYPNTYQTIWEYFDSHRNLYETYLVTTFDDTYPAFEDSIKAKYIDLNISVSNDLIEQEARDSLWHHVRYNYRGGFENHTAQTRIVASYGKLQLVYFDGIYENRYPNDLQTTSIPERLYTPERLNNTEHYYFSFSVKHLISKFNSPNHWNFYQEANWAEGFERTWRKVLNNYNGNDAEYGSRGCAVVDYGSKIMCWYNQLYFAIK